MTRAKAFRQGQADPASKSKGEMLEDAKTGYVHIGSCELRSTDVSLHIDRVPKFVYVEFDDRVDEVGGSGPLRGVAKALPYPVCTVLTDDVAFATYAAGAAVGLSPVDRPKAWVGGASFQ